MFKTGPSSISQKLYDTSVLPLVVEKPHGLTHLPLLQGCSRLTRNDGEGATVDEGVDVDTVLT